MYHMTLVSFFGLLYIVCSSGLIAFNKYLINPDRFPFAIFLVLMHAVFCSLCSGLLYICKPSLFPSLTDPARKVTIDSSLILRGALPIAVLFSAQLVLSNTAYLHLSVAFLQMMKEANLVLVYAFSLIAALERFSYRSMTILGFIIFATTLTIHGEVNFSWTGFVIQGLGQIFESAKIVLQAMLLTSAGRKLDALTYVMLVMPLCALILGAGMGVLIVFPHSHFATPQWHHVVTWWPLLLVNACVAFLLNVVIALFVKHSSAIAFILAGVVKDAMIVAVGGMFFREVITVIQGFGFVLQLGGILVWSCLKTFPDRFEDGVASGFGRILMGDCGAKGAISNGRSSPRSPRYGSTKEDSKQTA